MSESIEMPKTDVPPQETTPFFKRRPVRVLLGIVALLAVAGTAYRLHTLQWEETDDAFIEADVSPVGSRVSGQVLAVRVADNQSVNAGDILLEIDPADLRAADDRAKAAYDEAVANIALTRANTAATLSRANADLETATSAVTTAESQLAASRADLNAGRAYEAQKLADEQRYLTAEARSVSQSQIDSAKAAATEGRSVAASLEERVRSFESRLAEAQSKLLASRAGVDAARTGPRQVSVAVAREHVAKAELAAADLNLSYATVRAPISGRVTSRGVSAGEFVQPGRTLLAIVPEDFYVVANFKETQLARMRPGQPVDIAVDAYPDFIFKGRVDGIQAGTGARFSLLPPENATGNYVKVVQRVPVKIVFDADEKARRLLGVGMSVIPEVRVSGSGEAKH